MAVLWIPSAISATAKFCVIGTVILYNCFNSWKQTLVSCRMENLYFHYIKSLFVLEGTYKTPMAFYFKKIYGKETRDFSQNTKNNNYIDIAKLSVPSFLQYEWIHVYVQLSRRTCFSMISVRCSVAIQTTAFIAKVLNKRKLWYLWRISWKYFSSEIQNMSVHW